MQPRAGYGRGARGNRSGELHGRQERCQDKARSGSRELSGAQIQERAGSRYRRILFRIVPNKSAQRHGHTHKAVRSIADDSGHILPAQGTQEARIIIRRDNGTICSFGRFNGADSDSGGSPAPNLHSFAARRDMRRGVLDSFCRRAD